MTANHNINDLAFLFYGGGSDANYAFLLQCFNAGITAADLLALVGGGGGGGTPGAVWRVGAGAPSDATGVNGDFYLRSSNGDVYERASGTYSVVANIKGATGATGSAGADGATGATGSTGAAGPSTVADNVLTIQHAGATTKQGQLDTSLVTAGQTRVLKFQDKNGTIATTADVPGGDLAGTLATPTLTGTANVESIIRANTLDQLGAPAANLSMNSQRITTLADPSAAQDAMTKAYADAHYPTTVDIQEFPTAGTFSTGWTKPANALWVSVVVIGAGAGGGSGRCGAASSQRNGGSGGGAGGVLDAQFAASDLGTSEAVVVGAGGAGGAQAGTAAADGSNGGLGGNSSFAGAVAKGGSILGLSGGSKGASTDPTTACPGGAGSRVSFVVSGVPVSSLGGLALIAAGVVGGLGTNGNCPGGGGAGGSITAANALIAATAGGTGGVVALAGGTAGSPGTQGTAPTRKDHLGPGGGGGAASTSSAVDGFAGAAGRRGAGGAGGGAGTSGGTAKSGAGGAGGDGYVLVATICAKS